MIGRLVRDINQENYLHASLSGLISSHLDRANLVSKDLLYGTHARRQILAGY